MRFIIMSSLITFLYITLLIAPETNIKHFYNPSNTIMVFDMDDVFVKAHRITIALYSIKRLLTSHRGLLHRFITDSTFKTALQALRSHHLGAAYMFANLANLHPPLQPDFDEILTYFHTQRSLIGDVISLIGALKKAGYTIAVATNRDRIGTEITMNHLGFDSLYEGNRLFDLIITTDSAPFMKATCLKSGTCFSNLVPDAQYEGYIKTNTSFKPHADYFRQMRTLINEYAHHVRSMTFAEPYIFFFDDQIKNVEGALKSSSGIHAFFVPPLRKHTAIRTALASQGITGLEG